MEKRTDFHYSDVREPHRERTKKILKNHPEVRDLIGRNFATLPFATAIVGLMIFLAWWISDKPIWAMLLLAYTVGAVANHGLWVIIHECAHNLVFKKRYLNKWTAMLANLPHVLPSAISFQRYHIKHHAFQGVYELDADLPNRWEAKLVGNSWFGKALWLLLFPFFQLTRPMRLKEISFVDKWILTNWAVQFSFDFAIWYFWGPQALLFMLISLFFSVGLHPLGARWIQRHYITTEDGHEQETFSYYGPMNNFAFNVGYHNEHHDFPSIPWNKLPELKKTAPLWYESLDSHKSWTRLLFKFIFQREISLWSRVVRSERGKVELSDDSRPDRDLLEQEESTNGAPKKGDVQPVKAV